MYRSRPVMHFPALGWLALAAASLAQAPQEPTLRVTVNLVQVDAVVTDGKGRHVTDLKTEDFEIRQDGRPQKVTHSTYIRTGPPGTAAAPPKTAPRRGPLPPPVVKREQVQRTVAVVVDDLGLSFESMVEVRRALKAFVDVQMQPGDLVAILRTSGDIGALQQFTTDKRRLYATIDRLSWYWRSRVGLYPIGATGHRGHGVIMEPLEESVLSAEESLNRIMFVLNGLASLPGRKSMLLFSEYIALTSDSAIFEYAMPIERAYARLMDAATRSSATIYSIDPRGLRVFHPGPRGSNPDLAAYRESQWGMRYLAKATGGQFFSDNNEVSLLTRAVMDDQQGYYLLGYTPDASTFDPVTGRPKFHKIAVRVKRPGLRVRSHSGFLGEEDQVKLPEGPANAMLAALASPFGSSDMEVGMSSLFFNSAERSSYITTLLNVKAGGLTFGEDGDTRTAEGDIAVMVFGDNGALLERTTGGYSRKFSAKEFDLVSKNGLSFSYQLPVKKSGPYDVRVAVRDKATARIGTASQFVVVPELKAGRMTLSSIMLQTLPTVAEPPPSGNGSNLLAGSALRIFRPGETVTYGYQVLNPKPDKGTRQPKVEAKVSLYRDGKEFLTGKPAPVEVGSDPARLPAGGDVKVGADMPPGEYVLQVVVTDLLGDTKYRTATQYIDFRVAP